MTYWREVSLSYPCPVCNASPGANCMTASGHKKYEAHADRGREADRCEKCRGKLLADQLPGELCPRCLQVRNLEVERATYHVRRYP